MRGLSKVMMFVLLILFCLVGTLLIRIGIASYEEERAISKEQFDQRTPSGYITNKIRQHNVLYPIEIRKQEGRQVLVLTEEVEGEFYETWIYCLNHKLYEAYVSAGSHLALESGFELMDLEELSFSKNDRCLRVQLKTKNQDGYELLFEGGNR